MKVIDYCVLHRGTIFGLNHTILSALNEGWQPIGGISYVQLSNGDDQYLQALVKYSEEHQGNGIVERVYKKETGYGNPDWGVTTELK